jgi:N-carbamoylputrescine amidase
MKDIRIATVVCQSLVGEIRNNLANMSYWTESAKRCGASVVCFPEMSVTGYCSDAGITDHAEALSGSAADALRAAAGKNRVLILAGIAEKDETGRIFAAHLVVSPDETIRVYRKLHIAPPESSVLTPGDHIPLFDYMGMTFGVQLCYDAHFPELSSAMAVGGAEVIFMPHASPRGGPEKKFDSWMRHLPARAFDNSCFVLACNQTGTNGKGLYFPGISVAIDPGGNVIQKNISGKESLMIADLKADAIAAVRGHRMRFFLPRRRPELYSAAETGVTTHRI